MKNNRLVYSTENGRICPSCSNAIKNCVCKTKRPNPPCHANGDGNIRINRETKGRKGKTVTAIYGFNLDEAGLKMIAARLKNRCGTGGSVKNGIVIIQGDHRKTVQAELSKSGYAAKIAGG